MAESLPEGQSAIQISRFTDKELPSDLNMISREAHHQKASSPESDSKLKSVNMAISNGSKQQTDKGEWVVQDEPGVYLTLAALPSGGNELRRVRFRYRNPSVQYFAWKCVHMHADMLYPFIADSDAFIALLF